MVTHTEFESERRIRSELLLRCPGSSIEGEEFDDQYGDSGIGWIVDPIDGTHIACSSPAGISQALIGTGFAYDADLTLAAMPQVFDDLGLLVGERNSR